MTSKSLSDNFGSNLILMSVAALIAIAWKVISLYYAGNSHSEIYHASFWGYAVTVAILYLGMKAYSIVSEKKEISFSPAKIFGLAVLNVVFVASFFPMSEGLAGGTVSLIGKILGYSMLPILVVAVTGIFGKFVLSKVFSGFETYSAQLRIVTSSAFGFSIFLFVVAAASSTFGYSLYTTLLPLVLMGAVAHREFLPFWKALLRPLVTYDNHGSGKSAFPLVSTELLFFIFTFLLAVNLVSIVRPMPIGWDDLGAYMNLPKMMADTGEFGRIGIVAWQSITGMGFLLGSATQAFFLNQIGGVLSVVFVTLAISGLIRGESANKNRINIPLLAAVGMYALPMIVFQQAKDMKLDPALFAFSVAAIFVLYETIRRHAENKTEAFKLFALSGFIAGTAFAIKATTLMLFLGAWAAIFYAGLGLAGFYAFFGIFVGIFTKLGLWTMLNVNYPKDDTDLLNKVAIVSFAVAGLLLAYAIGKAKKEVFYGKVAIPLAVFGLAAFTAFAPWIVKNVAEAKNLGQPIGIGVILSGYHYPSSADIKSIRSADEIAAITKKNADAMMSTSGKTTNEDLGRYFGYENGINNYLKLPFNLTFQKNQPGEYTEISFLFLVFIPLIFVFLKYRNPTMVGGTILMMAVIYAYFFDPSLSKAITGMLAGINLPNGYFAIAAVIFIPLSYYHFVLEKKNGRNELFLLNMAFVSLYGFVFVISAFGIVWYGIAFYFCLLLAIAISAYEATQSVESEKEDAYSEGAKTFAAVVVFGVFMTYFVNSAIPHGWTNLRAAGFEEYKAGRFNESEAIFASHPDYLPVIATLNLKDPGKIAKETIASIKHEQTRKVVLSNVGESPSPEVLVDVLTQIANTKPGNVSGVPDSVIYAMVEAARSARLSFYKKVLHPSAEEKNTASIYRIGTFLTYFISENRKRYFDDSLVQQFGEYVYDQDPKVTVDRLSKLGIKYFLVDLNAATIDRDPRHDLTNRFENLLMTLKNDRLNLVKTDSLCLKTAISLQSSLKDDEYLTLAGVNYESYTGSGGVVYRQNKQDACHKYLADLIKSGAANQPGYEFLAPAGRYVQETLKSKPDATPDDMKKVVRSVAQHGWLALFELK